MKLLKFFIKLIIGIIIFVLIVVGAIWFAISSNVDNTPVDKYDATFSTEQLLANELQASLDEMGTSYSFDMIFDEDTLNQIIFATIRKSLNSEYNPGVENPTSKQEYVYSVTELDSSIPVIGGKSIGIKGVYAEYVEDDLVLNVVARVANVVKTRIYLDMNVETKETEYVLTVKELKFGKIGLTADWIKSILKTAGIENTLNDVLSDAGLPFTFKLDDLTFTATKEQLASWVNSVLNDEESDNGAMKKVFVNTFLAPENDMLHFGMFTKGFGIHVDLLKLKVDEAETEMPSTLTQAFNAEEVISNKAQTMVINNIANPLGDKYLSFTENDMTQLVYTKTEGYNDFTVDAEIIDGVFFHFDVAGIIFDINDDGSEIVIKVILNINGLKTTAVLKGRVEQVSDKIVKVFIDDVISLGSDLNISSEFMSQILAQNFTNGELMEFSAEENALIFSADVFNTFIANAMGSSSTPLKVKKLQFSKDGLDIYVEYSDPVLGAAMTTVTNMISNTLENGLALDPSDFSAEDAEALASVQENLNSISESLTNGSLTEEDTNALIDSVNSLSSEGQAAFFESIKDNVANEEELTNLYNLLFN